MLIVTPIVKRLEEVQAHQKDALCEARCAMAAAKASLASTLEDGEPPLSPATTRRLVELLQAQLDTPLFPPRAA